MWNGFYIQRLPSRPSVALSKHKLFIPPHPHAEVFFALARAVRDLRMQVFPFVPSDIRQRSCSP